MKIEKYFDEKFRKNLWRIDFTLKGKRIRESGFRSESQARKVIEELQLRERLAAFGIERAKPVTITLNKLYEARQADNNVSSKSAALRVLMEAIDQLGELPLTELKRAHIKRLTEHWQARLAIGSVNHYLGLLSASLHAAPLYFESLDEWKPPRIPRVRGQNSRERVLTRDELGRLFAELNKADYHPDYGDTLRLMLLTGARKKELIGLSVEKINQDWRTTQFLRTKNKTNRTAAMSDLAIEILQRRAGKPLLKERSGSAFERALKRASDAVGLIYGDQQKGGWVAHDLRHTAATVLESAGVKYSAVAAVLGHKRRDQTATYTHASLADLQHAVAVLDAWCREIDGFACRSVVVGEQRA